MTPRLTEPDWDFRINSGPTECVGMKEIWTACPAPVRDASTTL